MSRTFPKSLPRARASYLFYDNNCTFRRHLDNRDAETRAAFEGMALPVDVFHAKTKHKASDQFCQTNCNPALFSELYTRDPETNEVTWTFNSSAAEQANVWFGKFLPVVREMSEENFNFFLDEMISIHNAHRQSVLMKQRRRPHLICIEELRLPRY